MEYQYIKKGMNYIMKIILALLVLLLLPSIAFCLILAIVKKITKKSAKKPLSLAGISFIVWVIAVFAYPDTSDKGRNGVQNQVTVVSESTTSNKNEDSEKESSESKQSVDAEYINDNLWLENLTDFSEGKAWIEFSDSERKKGSVNNLIEVAEATTGSDSDKILYAMQNTNWQGDNRAAVIDTHGKIIWESELTKNSPVLKEISEFKEGLAYFVFNGNDKEIYNIIDSDGNVTFTKECTNDFIVLEHGNGLFLAAEHIANFDVDEWRFGAIDKNGNSVVSFKAYELSTPPVSPASVEAPTDNSSELQDIIDSINQLETEYQAWIEECWDYQGETDEEYYKKIKETEMEYKNQRTKLFEYKNQLEQEYDEQLEEYENYQQELMNYEMYINDYAPEKLSLDNDFLECRYLGENIYQLHFMYRDVLLNMETQKIIYTSNNDSGKHIIRFISDFKDGVATVLCDEGDEFFSNSICSLETDGTITPLVTNIWAKYVLGTFWNWDRELGDGLIFIPYNQYGDMQVYIDKEYYNQTGDLDAAYANGFALHTGAYYNIEGEVVIDFSEYNGKYEYDCGSFYSGYAVMTIMGADGLTYFTAINKNGDLMFEPKSGFDAVEISRDGKYITAVTNNSITVFDINGNSLVSVDYIGISLWNRPEGFMYNVCDGVIKINDFYVNIEDGTVIGLHNENDAGFNITLY